MSEAIPAGGVAAGGVLWDPACNGTQTASTVLGTSISGTVITSVHNVIADTLLITSGTSCVDYAVSKISDVAGNTALADIDNVALVSN
jgi:hypothetical protein